MKNVCNKHIPPLIVDYLNLHLIFLNIFSEVKEKKHKNSTIKGMINYFSWILNFRHVDDIFYTSVSVSDAWINLQIRIHKFFLLNIQVWAQAEID